MSRANLVAYTQADAARYLGVVPATVLRWTEEGLLETTDVVQGSGVYLTAASVHALKDQRDAEADNGTTKTDDDEEKAA